MRQRPSFAHRIVSLVLVAGLPILGACAGRAIPRSGAGKLKDAPPAQAEKAQSAPAAATAGTERIEPRAAVEAKGTATAAGALPQPGSSVAPAVVPPVTAPARPAGSLQRDAAGGGGSAPSAYIFPPERTVSASGARPSGDPEPKASSGSARQPSSGSESAPNPRAPGAPARPAAAPGRLQLAIVPAPATVTVGSVFTVEILAAATGSIDDAPFHLRFDPAVVEFVDGAPGDFLSQGGSSVVFLVDGGRVAGDVAVGIGRTERANGATGTGLLCRLRLRGLARGDTTLVVDSAKAWDASGEPVPVEANAGTASVR